MRTGSGDMALDIVGSVNMGISQASSDIDVVLYLKLRLKVRRT